MYLGSDTLCSGGLGGLTSALARTAPERTTKQAKTTAFITVLLSSAAQLITRLTERTVGRALRDRPARHSILCNTTGSQDGIPRRAPMGGRPYSTFHRAHFTLHAKQRRIGAEVNNWPANSV